MLQPHGSAQAYDTTLGIRLGSDLGVTFVQRVGKKVTLEGMYRDAIFDDNRNIDVLVKRHFNPIIRKINLFAGIGLGHISLLDVDRSSIANSASIPLMIGGELVISRLHLSVDYQPSIAFSQLSGQRIISSAAFSIRYIIAERKNQKFKNFFDKIQSSINRNK